MVLPTYSYFPLSHLVFLVSLFWRAVEEIFQSSQTLLEQFSELLYLYRFFLTTFKKKSFKFQL